MDQCDLVSKRSTCDRKSVGTVIVKEKNIISSGYNGSIPGAPHCDDVGHDLVDGHCQRVIHSEANAIAQAAKLGISVSGATLYCNTLPCYNCLKLIISAGIAEVVYRDEYAPEVKDRWNIGHLKNFQIRKFNDE